MTDSACSHIIACVKRPNITAAIKKDRNCNGGGVFIAYKNDLVLVHKPEFDMTNELVWAQLQITGSKAVYVGSLYRPPSDKGERIQQLDEALYKISKDTGTSNIWIGGDFNLPDI